MRPSQPRKHLATADHPSAWLTPKQREALLLVNAYTACQGSPPRPEVIVGALDVESPLAALYAVRTLERRGYLVTDPTSGRINLTASGKRLAGVEPVR